MIEFGGWLMPVQYAGILDEHRAVRERAGLFDLSHMGELFVEGPEAGAALAEALVTDPPALAVGRAQYSMIVEPDGGIIDDLIVYRLGENAFLVVANASNAQVVSDTLAERLGGRRAVLDDRSLATALVAVQGPRSQEILQPLTDVDARRRCATTASPRAASPGIPALVARTGYTGEDGFEVFVDTGRATALWDALSESRHRPSAWCPSAWARATRSASRRACRSTATSSTATRTRSRPASAASSSSTSPTTSSVARRSSASPRGRPGQAARRAARHGRGIARHGYPVYAGDRPTGIVTSGHPVADARRAHRDGLRRARPTRSRVRWSTSGSAISAVPAEVVPLPFYKRAR